MRVLHINCNYNTSKLHQIMLDHFDKEINNYVYCPIKYKKDEHFKNENDNNIIIEECFSSFERLFYFLKQKKILDNIKKHITKENFDLIHAYTLFTDGNVAMHVAEEKGIPYVVAVRGTDMNEFFTYRPYLIGRAIKIMKNASKIFFLSEHFMSVMINRYVPNRLKEQIAKKSVVIPNGIDDFWLKNKYIERNIYSTLNRIEKRELKVLCVSQIIKDKNIPFIQKNLHLLEKDGWKVSLSVVGRVVEEKEYMRILNDNITTYYRPLEKEELIYKYRENDIFILLSHYETFGLVYAEAMSQGLPVLYTRGQGFDGQFKDGIVGFGVSDKDSMDVKEKILTLIDNYAEISHNCLSNSSLFDWNRISIEYHQIYNEIIKKRIESHGK